MKILKLLLIMIFCAMPAVGLAQNEKYSRLEAVVLSAEPEAVAPGLIKTDFNGDTLGVVMVTSPLGNLKFDGNVFGTPAAPEMFMDGTYVYTLYMLQGSIVLKIRSSEYHEAKVVFPDPIAPAKMWSVSATGIEAVKGDIAEIDSKEYVQPVGISADDFATVYVDEEIVPGVSAPIYLEEGTHYVTARYNNEQYEQKIRVRNKPLEVDARMGGSITVKNAKDIIIRAWGKAPQPVLVDKGNHVEYTGLLGEYSIYAKPKTLSIKSVKKDFKIDQRGSREFRIDEMVPYMFICYHGTHLQPFGFTVAGCKRVGWFLSYSSDAKTKINTPIGKVKFEGTDSEGNKTFKIRSTSYTLSTGPMFRLKRKFYLQVGGGLARYLSTSTPGILTEGYKYKTGISANLEFQFRIKGFFIGAGYTHQFVSEAYNPNIANQISFTIGIASGV